MGDTGSLILGVIMVVMVIKFNELNINFQAPYAIHAAPVISIGILILPIIDTIRVFFIRISQKRSPFSPDMNHIHHKLLDLGNSHLKSTLLIGFINILIIAFTLALSQVLSINNLMICTFALGLTIANIPSLIIRYRTQASFKFSNENSEVLKEKSPKKIKIDIEPFYIISALEPNYSNQPKKIVKKELLESEV